MTLKAPPSTAQPAAPPSSNGASAVADAEILAQFERVITLSKHSQETFFDGMDSVFSRNFHALIDAHGVRAIDALRAYMDSDRANGEYVGEALKELGERDDAETHAARFDLLTECLFSVSDVITRDYVGRGIAALGDPAAIELVETALANDPTDFMQYSYGLVLEDLREIEEELKETKRHASQDDDTPPHPVIE